MNKAGSMELAGIFLQGCAGLCEELLATIAGAEMEA